LTQKKRIYDLAKEYGMTGQDLAKKLRDRGFSQIKGHMTALDDFQVLQIQGLLEAEGHRRVGAEGADSTSAGTDAGGGLVLRKKKKKLSFSTAETETDESAHETPAVAPEAASARPTASAQAASTAAAPSVARAAQAAPAAETEEVERAPTTSKTSNTSGAGAAPLSEVTAPLPVEAPASPRPRITPAASEVAAIAKPAPSAPAPESESIEAARPTAAAAPVEARAAGAAPASAPVASTPVAKSSEAPPASTTPAVEETVASDEGAAKVVTPLPARRLGKVVGFIDLSKIKSAPQKKTESRRLRSKDDVAPNVQPTLGHDKKRALLRGDRGTRGQLSAGQLREREAGRFLRRRGPTPAGGPAPSGGPSRPSRTRGGSDSSSPYAGGQITVELPLTVRKLADKLSVKSSELITTAIRHLGMDMFKVNINSLLDEDTAVLLAHEFGVELLFAKQVAAEEALISDLKKKRKGIEDEHLILRPPTVAFLGHVDHGKTTLIDAIRNSRVAEGEAGGITQHIGAYQVTTKKGHTVTIIDTPGHAAFTAMRARGARAVDIVVLVVAADDGVMPHTDEALNHARAAKVPVVVALTKIDKPEANSARAMQQLAGLGLTPEVWGGETAMLEVSAVKNVGVEELLERVFLESEVLELKSHPQGPAQGVVLEAEIQQGKGIVAHLLVQDGTLNRGDIILAGEGYGKVRSMHDDRGNTVEHATPSMPVEVSGLSALPGIGESFYVVDELAQAKEVAEERERKNRAMSLTERRSVSAESLTKVVAAEAKQMINLVVRADVQGSVEVLRSALGELKHEEIEVRVLHAGVGAVTESDVLLASSSSAIIIAFHVGVNDKARTAAERANIPIRYYEIIYQLLDDMRDLMEGTLSPEISEEVTGHVEIRALFKSSKVGTIAGSHVTDGTIARDSKIRLVRNGQVLHTGALASLRREKDDVREVREGFDCGLVIRDFQDVQPGDVVEAFKVVKKRRTLGDKASV
jgi:translation initiation factor IF-2